MADMSNGGERAEGDARVRRFIERGGQVVGGAAGAAIGLLGGPAATLAGGAAGAVLGEGLAHAAIEFYERVLTPKQGARAATALALATVRINDRLEHGDHPRDDFADPADREDAEEILEGTLLAAANAYEQRKVPFFANFFANLAFSPEISPSYANLLLNFANRLTYGQMTALAVVGDTQNHETLRVISAQRAQGEFGSLPEVIAELDDLGVAGLVGIGQEDGSVARAGRTWGGGDFATPEPLAGARLTADGQALHDLFGLQQIPQADKNRVLRDLAGGHEPPGGRRPTR